MTETMTLQITIQSETREIEFMHIRDEFITSIKSVGAYQKRPGQKIWHDRLRMWKQADGSWKLQKDATILNRNGYRLIGWAGTLGNVSQHNASYHVTA